MPTLYLAEQGSSLRKRGETITIDKDGKVLLNIEIHRLDTILIFGNVQVSTQAMTELLDKGVEVSLLSMDGRLKGQITPPLPKNADLRLQQHLMLTNDDFILKQASHIVSVKVENALELVKEIDWRSCSQSLHSERDSLVKIFNKIPTAESINEIMGLEGAAANVYFKLFPVMLKKSSELFNGRSRRPPLDPVNAVLSLGYTLLTSHLQSLLDAHGFDPYIGFLHQVSFGRPSLALDLLEPYRTPIVDKFALKTFNLGIFKSSDFTITSENGCRFNPDSLKRFFAEWDKFLRQLEVRNKMKTQIDSLARVLRAQQDVPEHPRYKAN